MQHPTWLWPGNKRIAVVFNICLEAWSDGKAPGISPMGNPLAAGLLDTMAISWAAYGVNRGIYRMLDGFARHGARATVLANTVIAERAPAAIRACAEAGHEVANHGFAMDVLTLGMTDAEERDYIRRCTGQLEAAAGTPVTGWLSPRATSAPRSPGLLAEAGYRWCGDALDEDLPYVVAPHGKPIAIIPLSTDVNDMPFMKYGNPPGLMLASFEENLDIALARDEGPRVIDITVHAQIFGRPRGAHFLERIIERAANTPEVWIGTRGEIAAQALLRHAA